MSCGSRQSIEMIMQSLSENLIYPTLIYIDIFFYFPINYCWVQLIMGVIREMEVI